MKKKLDLPFEYFFLPEDMPCFVKTGNTLTIVDFVGLVFCTDGSIELTNDVGTYKVNQGEMFFYIPSAFLHIGNISHNFKCIVLKTTMGYIMPIANRVLDIRTQLYLRDHPRVTLDESQADNIRRLLFSLHERMEIENSADIQDNQRIILTELIKSIGETLCFEIFNICAASLPTDELPNDRNDTVFQNFMISLSYNYRKERNVAFYAAEQYLSYSYFSDIIKQKSGITALRWISDAVINNARHMLEYTNMSIKEIANRLKFPTQSFFGKYFKQYVGISPKEYRRRIRLRDGTAPTKEMMVQVHESKNVVLK
ncbi:MAG: AraC family transcriptional regulator [Prevotella sp.]|nr:AraC family transcriptional regulator [Prevotella sp.]MCI1282805.1 AraC family transcriptional regulator [Prevotella sp.]